VMFAPTAQSCACSFPDFDDEGFTIEAKSFRDAAEAAAARWERDIEDFRGRKGLETLRIAVNGAEGASSWEVLGEAGRYVAKSVASNG
jgi:hypothetical protein